MSPAGEQLAVDVVVTNHNYGRFLAEALESACAQSHPAVRVIVVDDGSSDDSRTILEGFADRVEVILQDRGGQAAALNAGFARCRGDVLVLLDADDRLRPDAASAFAAAFAADPGLAKVQFQMEVVDAAGNPTGETKPVPHLSPPQGEVVAAELAHPFDLPWLPGGGTAFAAEAVARILPIPVGDFPRCGADWYLVHLTALLGRAAYLDRVCADYRVHGDNGYELNRSQLNLDHVRESTRFAAATTRALERLADEQELPRPSRILSVADLANRLISLRLDPQQHPISSDGRAGLLADAARAIKRRSDVSWSMKTLFLAWFTTMAAAPRVLARPLAELFLFPERRRRLNGVLGRLQRGAGEAGGSEAAGA
jgi:glycosyltransferase involved in cell wall biosynthesis